MNEASRFLRYVIPGLMFAIEYTVFNPVLPPLESLLPGLTVRIMKRLEGLRSTWLRSLGGALIVKATKR